MNTQHEKQVYQKKTISHCVQISHIHLCVYLVVSGGHCVKRLAFACLMCLTCAATEVTPTTRGFAVALRERDSRQGEA